MHKTDLDDFRKVLNSHGYPESDFELNHIDLTQWDAGAIVPIQGSVTITRKSTGKSKLYNTGHGTRWVAVFDIDLTQGVYN